MSSSFTLGDGDGPRPPTSPQSGSRAGAARPLLLDLFCGAGGAAVGYHRAGFDVVGVDIVSQPHYPFLFWREDALTIDPDYVRTFDAIHASPPCQAYSAMSACRPGLAGEYPDLIAPTRTLLEETGVPWVIENVPGAPLRNPTLLCGQMFGLKLFRHRMFETSFPMPLTMHPPHGQLGSRAGHHQPGRVISVSGNCSPIALAREAMGIDWMTRNELAESIPPAFTEHMGAQLLQHVRCPA